MASDAVQIGILGCDGYPQELIRRIRSLVGEAVITAAVSPDPRSPGANGLRKQGVPVYASTGAMLDAGGFEVVINATPIHLHAGLTRLCLEAGYPVWMEKPPTATIQELDGLRSVAAARGLPVAVCFNWLYSPLVRDLQAELAGGRFGAVERVRGIGAWVRAESYFGRSDWSGRVQLGEDWVLDGSVNNPFAHVVCNGLFFAGPEAGVLAEPAEVEAELYRANDIESEDTSCVRVRTAGGIEVLTHLTLAPEKEIAPTTVIDTEQACIRLVDFQRVEIAWRDGRTETRRGEEDNRVGMLRQLCRTFRAGGSYGCDLSMCRPFTVAVNAAFDAAGEVGEIPEAAILRRGSREGPARAVRGINRLLEHGHAGGSLFSELGVPWARAGTVQPAADYRRFPVRFGAGIARPREA